MKYTEALYEHDSTMVDFIMQSVRQVLHIDKDKSNTTRGDAIKFLATIFSNLDDCKRFYNNLSELEQLVIRDVVHGNGVLSKDRMLLKYGSCTKTLGHCQEYFWNPHAIKSCSPITALFSLGNIMPTDLLERFKTFVPAPEKITIPCLSSLPDKYYSIRYAFELVQHDTEEAALTDVTTMLRLCEQGNIPIRSETGIIASTAAKQILEMLHKGDFYTNIKERAYDVQMGAAGIRPFAWPMILLTAGAAKIVKQKLCISAMGIKNY